MVRLTSLGALVVAAMLVVVGWPEPASAHTDFDSSDPANGAVVQGPIDTVTIRFTGEAAPAGEGFVLLDPELGQRAPSGVETPEPGLFVLRFDPAIGAGAVGVRWSVEAGDSHAISGSFQFTVNPPAPPPTPVPGAAAPAAPGTSAPPTQTEAPTSNAELDDFLDTSTQTSESGRIVADVGRALSMGATMVALGFLVFALTVLRGTKGELSMLLAWARCAGVLLAVGTAVDAAGQVMYETGEGVSVLSDVDAYTDTLSGSPAVALLVRFAGGFLVACCARLHLVRPTVRRELAPTVSAAGSRWVPDGPEDDWDQHRWGQRTVERPADHWDQYPGDQRTVGQRTATWQQDPRGAWGAERPADQWDQRPWDQPSWDQGTDDRTDDEPDHRPVSWRLGLSGLLAMVGSVGLLVSHCFDGHSVSEGNRILTASAAAVHVLAAATWTGGVIALALVVRRRMRSDEAPRALVLATRFSVVATLTLAAVTALGAYLAYVILDAPRELWTTDWGRFFLAKAAVVGVAALLGARNHFVIIPRLEASADHPEMVGRLRSSLVKEVVVMAAVVVLTSLLVQASSTP